METFNTVTAVRPFPAEEDIAAREADAGSTSRREGLLSSAAARRFDQDLTKDVRLFLLVFLPFAAGFYLSYVFRTINALISNQLGLGAADLGLLTSVYFLTFAAAQLPVGVLLDRYGPRRIQSALLLIAAAGAAIFGASKGFGSLILGRALVGLGTAASLNAGLKAIVLWYPKERAAPLNGYMVMLGALGAVTATIPAERVLAWIGWQHLFELLAGVTAACAVATFFLVPEATHAQPTAVRAASVSLRTIYADPRFWRLAPLSATCIGTAWSLQSLWAASWLTDVEGLERAALVQYLFIMAAALSAGALILGIVVNRLGRRGVGPRPLLAFVAALFIVCQLTLILRCPIPSCVPWGVVAVVGAATVLSNSILAEYVPKELAGRANAALNVFHIGGAFLLQFLTGLIVQQWTNSAGHYPAIAYQVAFAFNVALQIAALVWFEPPLVRELIATFVSATTRDPARVGRPRKKIVSYYEAAAVWSERLNSARMQASNWRLAALGSIGPSVLLGVALAILVGRAGVAAYVTGVDNLHELRSADAATVVNALPDAQIAYFLSRFIKNVRSLPLDPIVVSRNWQDAFAYLTDDGARTLKDPIGYEPQFRSIGKRAISVELIHVVRASDDSFEISWKEHSYESGIRVNSEQFTGRVFLILGSPDAAGSLSRNPIGLYINRIDWSRDLR
jgi:type IV secretory pathway TrbF-like protein/sugar phosphate permease